MDGTNIYEDVPIKPDGEVRLLRLLDCSTENDIWCELNSFDLWTAKSYTAVSYTWGLAILSRTIHINGKPIRVRENVWQFLDRLRRNKQRGLYWIDALCIYQSCIPEKNQQVSLMQEIYKRVRLETMPRLMD